MTEIQQAHKKLMSLLIAHPDLPIVASVYSEVVADDGIAYWFGDVEESCYVDTLWAGNEQMWSLNDALDDVVYFLDWEFPGKVPDVVTPEDKKKLEKFVRDLPWKKVIVLNITTLDSLQGDNEE